MTKWKPAMYAPRDAWPLAIAATITCECGKGGRIVMTGARHNGEWVIDTGGFEHSFDVTDYYELPKPPARSGVFQNH